jgi:hypothetical protein
MLEDMSQYPQKETLEMDASHSNDNESQYLTDTV